MERLDRIYRYEQACEFLPHRLKSLALSLPDKQKERVEELRLRVMHPLTVLTGEGELNAAPDGIASLVKAEDLEQMLGAVTEYSRYACIETLRQGFLPLRGGFRLGVCGSAVVREGEVNNLKDISSLALRIVCEHIGLGSDIAPRLFDENGRFMSTLLLSPPGGGKTTLLRECVRRLSDQGLRISLMDERGEIAVVQNRMPQFDVGANTDIMTGGQKAACCMMLLRAMRPDVLAFDEISAPEDIEAMRIAAGCGVALLATAHAQSVGALRCRTLYRALLDEHIFRRAVCITRSGGARFYTLEELP